jgi:hypothetical protein
VSLVLCGLLSSRKSAGQCKDHRKIFVGLLHILKRASNGQDVRFICMIPHRLTETCTHIKQTHAGHDLTIH